MTESKKKSFVLKIGSKGEIFPPKEIRQKLGLTKDQPILLTQHKNTLIIRKIHSIEELLKKPAKVEISYHAWKQFKKELSQEVEK